MQDFQKGVTWMSYVCVKHARLGLGGMHLCAFLHRNTIWTAWCTHEQESSRSICKIFPPCRDVTLETRRVWLQLFEREWLFVCFDNGWWQAVHYHHRELLCKIITFKTSFLHVVLSPDLIRHVYAHCGWVLGLGPRLSFMQLKPNTFGKKWKPAVAGSQTQDTSGLSRQCSATEPQQPDNHQPSQSSICTALNIWKGYESLVLSYSPDLILPF